VTPKAVERSERCSRRSRLRRTTGISLSWLGIIDGSASGFSGGYRPFTGFVRGPIVPMVPGDWSNSTKGVEERRLRHVTMAERTIGLKRGTVAPLLWPRRGKQSGAALPGSPGRSGAMARQPESRQRARGRGKVVSQTFASWNQLDGWLRQVDGLRRVAGGVGVALDRPVPHLA
jgi:hypothetical protein